MAIVDPKKIVFECEDDVIDYVSKGIPPTKKNYREFINRVKSPLSDIDVDESLIGNTVIIRESLLLNCDKDTLERSLNRVYANRKRNMNIALAVAGIVAGVLIFGGMKDGKHSSESSSSDAKDLEMDMSPENFPKVDL